MLFKRIFSFAVKVQFKLTSLNKWIINYETFYSDLIKFIHLFIFKKDNLNVFLKACHDHFNLAQANLFDITDLEDLDKRRGTTDENNSDRSIGEEQHRRLKKVIHFEFAKIRIPLRQTEFISIL